MGMKVGFIGAGAMAEALISGILASGWRSAAEICASDPSDARREELAGRLGIVVFPENAPVVAQAELVVLAVKPQVIEEVLRGLRGSWRPGQLVVSIAAGVPLARLAAEVGPEVALVRAMPNNPCLVRQAATALAAGPGVTAAQLAEARALFAAAGTVVEVPEHLLDAVTGLSGSGPAYVYLVLEALSDAGVLVGLPREVATQLATQTVLGAASMVQATGLHPAVLKERVTSPGGTTIAGLAALEAGGVRAAFLEAVRAATARSRELGACK